LPNDAKKRVVNKVVLDASALLALIFDEPGAEKLTFDLLQIAAIGTVNLAEVQTRLVRSGDDPAKAWLDSRSYVREIHPFTAEQARIAGDLEISTRSLGLSLGDRACLALAIALQAPVYTAHRIWASLNVGVEVRTLR
jgi:ribonuclease VapC